MNIAVFLEGFGIGAGLIMAIGAQNVFVLRQGILRQQVLLVAIVCSLIDAVLIAAGVLGLGNLINTEPLVLRIATGAGSVFLLWYGIRSFRAGLNPEVMPVETDQENRSGPITKTWKSVILTLLGFSLLNPHVYLDTVILLGGIGARHPLQERFAFIAGACSASVLWFFGLAFGASFLAALFQKKITWRILDFLIAGIMFLIAIQLALFGIRGS